MEETTIQRNLKMVVKKSVRWIGFVTSISFMEKKISFFGWSELKRRILVQDGSR